MEQGRINIKMKQATPTASKMQMGAYTDQHTIGQVNVSVAMCNECAALEHFFCCLFFHFAFYFGSLFPVVGGWAVEGCRGRRRRNGRDGRRQQAVPAFHFILFSFVSFLSLSLSSFIRIFLLPEWVWVSVLSVVVLDGANIRTKLSDFYYNPPV